MSVPGADSRRSGALAGTPSCLVGAIALELLRLVFAPPVVRLTLFLAGLFVGLGILLLITHLPISIGRCSRVVREVTAASIRYDHSPSSATPTRSMAPTGGMVANES